jgi:ketosteroid isomerase-like protein
VVAPPPTTAAAAPEVTPTRDVTVDLREVVGRYAQAISARDVSAIRAVYPRLTSEQQRGFEQFFASTKSLQATLSLSSIDVRDATATGRISGVYAFTSSSGRNEKQSLSFRATFEKQGEKWVLASVQ